MSSKETKNIYSRKKGLKGYAYPLSKEYSYLKIFVKSNDVVKFLEDVKNLQIPNLVYSGGGIPEKGYIPYYLCNVDTEKDICLVEPKDSSANIKNLVKKDLADFYNSTNDLSYIDVFVREFLQNSQGASLNRNYYGLGFSVDLITRTINGIDVPFLVVTDKGTTGLKESNLKKIRKYADENSRNYQSSGCYGMGGTHARSMVTSISKENHSDFATCYYESYRKGETPAYIFSYTPDHLFPHGAIFENNKGRSLLTALTGLEPLAEYGSRFIIPFPSDGDNLPGILVATDSDEQQIKCNIISSKGTNVVKSFEDGLMETALKTYGTFIDTDGIDISFSYEKGLGDNKEKVVKKVTSSRFVDILKNCKKKDYSIRGIDITSYFSKEDLPVELHNKPLIIDSYRFGVYEKGKNTKGPEMGIKVQRKHMVVDTIYLPNGSEEERVRRVLGKPNTKGAKCLAGIVECNDNLEKLMSLYEGTVHYKFNNHNFRRSLTQAIFYEIIEPCLLKWKFLKDSNVDEDGITVNTRFDKSLKVMHNILKTDSDADLNSSQTEKQLHVSLSRNSVSTDDLKSLIAKEKDLSLSFVVTSTLPRKTRVSYYVEVIGNRKRNLSSEVIIRGSEAIVSKNEPFTRSFSLPIKEDYLSGDFKVVVKVYNDRETSTRTLSLGNSYEDRYTVSLELTTPKSGNVALPGDTITNIRAVISNNTDEKFSPVLRLYTYPDVCDILNYNKEIASKLKGLFPKGKGHSITVPPKSTVEFLFNDLTITQEFVEVFGEKFKLYLSLDAQPSNESISVVSVKNTYKGIYLVERNKGFGLENKLSTGYKRYGSNAAIVDSYLYVFTDSPSYIHAKKLGRAALNFYVDDTILDYNIGNFLSKDYNSVVTYLAKKSTIDPSNYTEVTPEGVIYLKNKLKALIQESTFKGNK